MTTYYIKSSGGSDANAGTTTAGAFATVSKGCIAAIAGDTIVCLTGTYNSSLYINTSNMKAGTTALPITLKSVTQYAAKFMALAAPASSAMLECRRDGWIIDGFEFDARSGYTHTTTYAWLLGGTGQYRQGIYYSGANGIIQNNHVHDICLANPGGSGGAGIEVEGFYNSYISNFSQIRYNIVHDTASPDSTNKSHGVYMTTRAVKINGNIVYNMFDGVLIHGWHGFDGPSVISNNTVFNNTNSAILMGQGDGGANTSTPGPSNVKCFNNIMRDCNTGFSNFHGSTSPPTGTSNAVAANLSFNVVNPYGSLNSLVNIGIKYSGDPKMVNYIQTGGGDYHLSANSTAIDRGIASLSGQNAPILDIDGVARPQNTQWDVGAFEFVSTGGGGGGSPSPDPDPHDFFGGHERKFVFNYR